MIDLTRRSVILGGLAAMMPGPVQGADWPTRSITIIHGFPAGGTVDLVSRIISDHLARRLGQPVIVETKPGASGTTSAGLVARSAPDGYTLYAIPSGHVIVGATFKSLPYKTVDDFTGIGTTVEFPYVLVTSGAGPLRNVRDFVSLGQSRSTPLLYGTPGNGSGPHMAIERLAALLKIRVQHVPYRGSSAAVVDLIGERIDFMMDPPGPLLQFVKSGQLRALAVTGGGRFFSLPDTPTLQEAGVPGYIVTSWQGLLAPAGLPEPILKRLNTELNQILQDPDVVARCRALGTVPKSSEPAAFQRQMTNELADWTAVVSDTKFERI